MLPWLRSSTVRRAVPRREYRRIYLFFACSTIQNAIPLSEGNIIFSFSISFIHFSVLQFFHSFISLGIYHSSFGVRSHPTLRAPLSRGEFHFGVYPVRSRVLTERSRGMGVCTLVFSSRLRSTSSLSRGLYPERSRGLYPERSRGLYPERSRGGHSTFSPHSSHSSQPPEFLVPEKKYRRSLHSF